MNKFFLLIITVMAILFSTVSFSAEDQPIYLDNGNYNPNNINSIIAPSYGLHPGSGTDSAGPAVGNTEGSESGAGSDNGLKY